MTQVAEPGTTNADDRRTARDGVLVRQPRRAPPEGGPPAVLPGEVPLRLRRLRQLAHRRRGAQPGDQRACVLRRLHPRAGAQPRDRRALRPEPPSCTTWTTKGSRARSSSTRASTGSRSRWTSPTRSARGSRAPRRARSPASDGPSTTAGSPTSARSRPSAWSAWPSSRSGTSTPPSLSSSGVPTTVSTASTSLRRAPRAWCSHPMKRWIRSSARPQRWG